MRKVVGIAYTWGDSKIKELSFNAYPDMNILHRDKLAGVQRGRSGHKILCYDPPEGTNSCVLAFERGWKGLPTVPRWAIFAKYVWGSIPDEKGQLLTARDLANKAKMSKIEFDCQVNVGLGVIDKFI